MILVQVQWFETGARYCVEKGLKLKVRKCCGKLADNLFAFPPSPILNRVESELTDSRPKKTIKKKKYRFHCFIDCILEVTCIVTVIILENMFGNINSAVVTYGRVEERQMFCWACKFPLCFNGSLNSCWKLHFFTWLVGCSTKHVL